MQKTVYPSPLVQTDSIGLFSGKMGFAVYWFHCSRINSDCEFEEKALNLINDVKAAICKTTVINYAEGLSGIVSTFSYLLRESFIKPFDEYFFTRFDAYLINQLCYKNHIDLSRSTGLIGIGYYLLNRIKYMPANKSMASLKMRHILLLAQDILFARLGMNGYTYPFKNSETLPASVMGDIKRFLKDMLKLGLCPELTLKAITIVDKLGYAEKTVFEKLEDAYNEKNIQVFRHHMEKLAESPEDSPAKQLAILQMQDMSLPAWWELF